MGYFGYQFIGKAPEVDASRRSTSDWYANLAQLSQLVFIVAIPSGKLALAALGNLLRSSKKLNRNIETDSTAKHQSVQRTSTSVSIMNKKANIAYGVYEQWIFGIFWTAWLAFLCFNDTWPDYMHLVKRFGLTGASQLPLHYLLSAKHPYTPLRLLPKTSRRQLLSLHMITGRTIILFITLHSILYSSIFIHMNMFWKAVQQSKIIVAILSLVIFGSIGVTSMSSFRRRAFSSFYKVHLFGSAIIPMLLFFHVRHLRIYVLECAAVVVLNTFLRLFCN